MKIMQIHNEYKYFGGEDTVLENEKIILVKNGHEVTQIIRNNNNEIKNIWDQLIISRNLIHSKKSEKIINDKINLIKPDIVHIHNFFPLWTTSILDACLKNRVPVVMTLHNYRLLCAKASLYRNGKICELCPQKGLHHALYYGCYQNSFIKTLPVVNLLFNIKKKKLWLKIDKLIALTKFGKKKFIEFGIPENKLTVKPNFIDESKQVKNFNPIKEEFVLYIGRLTKEKGIETLLKAWEKIDYKLKIFGDGPLKEKIKKIINKNKKIELNESVPNIEISKKMSQAKFLIFPSGWYEGFSMVLLEAFSNKLPVLSSDIGSMKEIITDKKNGILFKTNNVEDLIEKINFMINNPNLLNTIKEKAYDRYLDLYAPQKNYEMLIKIYKETIENYNLK
jgi:glycosyltransferase involved in cell wall biosynthesis